MTSFGWKFSRSKFPGGNQISSWGVGRGVAAQRSAPSQGPVGSADQIWVSENACIWSLDS